MTDEYVIENDPGHVEHIEGSDLGRVFLTPDAATRLGIETAAVTTSGRQLTVPRTAVFVDPEGVWWVYTNPRPHQFVRHEVRIAREGDDRASEVRPIRRHRRGHRRRRGAVRSRSEVGH